MPSAKVDVEEIREQLAAEFHASAAEAQNRVTAILDPGRPTPEFMAALADELSRAVADPSSVPYPDLADPDRYWTASVQPQIAACDEHIAAVLTWLESQVVQTMGVAETDLKRVVEVAVAEQGPNPVADRTALATALEARCTELHHQMAELLEVVPDRASLEAAQEHYTAELRRRAQADVDSLKAAYLSEAGGDDAHQRFAEQQWSETYSDRIAHREALLAGTPPWRHQYLALTGYDRSLGDAEQAVERLVSRLQAPLAGLPALLLERYDEAVAG
ncbi:MAG: hypothetical protein AAGA90_23490 [Actinomycetota bacterium]